MGIHRKYFYLKLFFNKKTNFLFWKMRGNIKSILIFFKNPCWFFCKNWKNHKSFFIQNTLRQRGSKLNIWLKVLIAYFVSSAAFYNHPIFSLFCGPKPGQKSIVSNLVLASLRLNVSVRSPLSAAKILGGWLCHIFKPTRWFWRKTLPLGRTFSEFTM